MTIYQIGNHSLNSFGIGKINISVPNALKAENENMTEFKKIESEVQKFEKEGDNLQGVFIGVEKSATGDNKVYKIKTKDGKIKAVFGTVILSQLMEAVSLGTEVQIILKGFKPNKDKAKNNIKLFEVYAATE